MSNQTKLSIQDVIKMSESHGPLGGKRALIKKENYDISIVGGRNGLYGDFVETFEVAIIDNRTREFITKQIFPDAYDDVLPYLSSEEVENIINSNVV